MSISFSRIAIVGVIFVMLLASGCSNEKGPSEERQQIVATESQRLNDWFAARFKDEVNRSPMTATYLGIDIHQDRLDDSSLLAANETNALVQSWLTEMRKTFDSDRLDPSLQLSYRLYEYLAEEQITSHGKSDHTYIFQHMTGPHTDLPSFMINFHSVSTRKDAENYIARLGYFPSYLGHFVNRAEAQSQNGVMLPAFVYPKVRDAALKMITGEPFTEDGDSPLWTDISSKIEALDLPDNEITDLKNAARRALIEAVKPAFLNIIEMTNRHEALTSEDDGVWKLPNGEAYYQSRLNLYTTTMMSADEIHETGLKEVARIQDEMRIIQDAIGYDGSLQDFFNHLRTDPQFTFENNDEGRSQYIEQATAMIDTMKAELDGLFITKPQADLIVKRVEPFREQSAFGAFYNRPAPDGSKPGTYYINLKDMSELPIYQMQALAYHEGIPGHHMQIAIAQEIEGLPKFRTLGGYTAYTEGWALYAESVPAELDLYTDPYQDFGRLSMEIFRAARLVVDTGIHHKKWTREQAVEYMLNNTANAEGDIRTEVDRYIVWPGQATAYKIGMLKIQALRQQAEEALDNQFDLREFHDVILANGSVPLTVLEELVVNWTQNAAN